MRLVSVCPTGLQSWILQKCALAAATEIRVPDKGISLFLANTGKLEQGRGRVGDYPECQDGACWL